MKPTAAPTEPPKPDPEKIGYAAYAKQLDKTVYTKALGALYTKKATTFKLWSPVADSVKVCIYKTGSDGEAGSQMLSNNPMKFSAKYGTWYLTLKGDYKNMYYTYQVTVNGKTNEVVDPYAYAVGVNGNRGMIVDLDETDPKGWEKDSFNRVQYATDAVVWEVSVRDFSASPTSGVSEKNRGKFLAFTETETTLNGDKNSDYSTCVEYLKELGVNYVQINPFYDFASIDESDTESEQYNWGYDPKNYNVPEGSYSSNPYDGRVRIKECKAMIQALHNAGIGVIMDVVYNHTYFSEDSFFNQIAPYYYHRFKEDGSWSNGSGCGNDVATERYMVRRYIRDSVTYWAKEYHIDGFRFDLMGLMDVDTMNTVRASLDKLPGGVNILMYGEAWNMTTAVSSVTQLANQGNMNLLNKRIGAFNDTSRDAIKGSNFNAADQGYVQKGANKSGIRAAIDADGGGWATVPNQCVNYSSCHDNMTLYDKLTASVYGDEAYNERREDLVNMNKLSGAIVLMSRGMPFMLAGEEFCRTKMGDDNSYKSSVEINQIDWSYVQKYASVYDYYAGLIKLRNTVGVFSDATGKESTVEYLDSDSKGSIAYSMTTPGKPTMVVAFNGNTTQIAKVTLPEGKWILLADGNRSGIASLGEFSGSYTVGTTSSAVFVDADSFSGFGIDTGDALMYVRYTDQSTGYTLFEQRCTGRIGDKYDVSPPDEIVFRYDITGSSALMDGQYTEQYSEIEVPCEKYEGGFSSVTFKFLNSNDASVSPSIVMTNRVGQHYYSPNIPKISGYELDLKNLPNNGAGYYSEEPIEVIYRFKPIDKAKKSDCMANVIYMSDTGEILDRKRYKGDNGDSLVVDQLSFSGYDYVGVSDSYAAFLPGEINVIVNYAHHPANYVVYIIIAAVAVVLLGIASIFFKGNGKKRKMSSIDIEE